MNDTMAEAAVKRRRRRLIIVALEILLGDLVALDGIEGAKKAIDVFRRQLEEY